MPIFSYQIKISLPECHSLKEKRGVLKSLFAHLRRKFNVSVTEIGHQDVWQTALLGMAWVTSDPRFGQKMLEGIKLFIADAYPAIWIENEDLEIL